MDDRLKHILAKQARYEKWMKEAYAATRKGSANRVKVWAEGSNANLERARNSFRQKLWEDTGPNPPSPDDEMGRFAHLWIFHKRGMVCPDEASCKAKPDPDRAAFFFSPFDSAFTFRDPTRKRVSRDPETDLKHMSLPALRRIMDQADKRGDDKLYLLTVREMERRTRKYDR